MIWARTDLRVVLVVYVVALGGVHGGVDSSGSVFLLLVW